MEQSQERLETSWRHAIEQGEVDPGSDIPYTADSSRQIAQDAERAVGTAEPIDPDALP